MKHIRQNLNTIKMLHNYSKYTSCKKFNGLYYIYFFTYLIYFHFRSDLKKSFFNEIIKSFFLITLNVLLSLGSALFCNYFFKKVEVTRRVTNFIWSLVHLKIECKKKETFICYEDEQRSYKSVTGLLCLIWPSNDHLCHVPLLIPGVPTWRCLSIAAVPFNRFLYVMVTLEKFI